MRGDLGKKHAWQKSVITLAAWKQAVLPNESTQLLSESYIQPILFFPHFHKILPDSSILHVLRGIYSGQIAYFKI